MTTAKKHNLFEEIREGLEAYRDRREGLPQRRLSTPDVKAIREQLGMSQADMANARKLRTGSMWSDRTRAGAPARHAARAEGGTVRTAQRRKQGSGA